MYIVQSKRKVGVSPPAVSVHSLAICLLGPFWSLNNCKVAATSTELLSEVSDTLLSLKNCPGAVKTGSPRLFCRILLSVSSTLVSLTGQPRCFRSYLDILNILRPVSCSKAEWGYSASLSTLLASVKFFLL